MQKLQKKMLVGDAGYWSPYLSHAKRALYHLSYIPCVVKHVTNKYLIHFCSTFQRLCGNARQNSSHITALSRTFDSSVGRAVDCSCNTWEQTSIGHWFKSGSKDNIIFKSADRPYFALCFLSQKRHSCLFYRPYFLCINVYGHTMLNTPVLVWSLKLSNIGPS